MIREKLKWLTHEGESTNAKHGGGPTHISVEVSVMEMERRGWIIWPYCLVNQRWEEPGGKAKPLEFVWRLGDKSQMTGDCHVRLCVQLRLACSAGGSPAGVKGQKPRSLNGR